MHRRKKKSQVYEKRPGNDADDIDISEVSENSQPFGITVSLWSGWIAVDVQGII